MKPDDVLVFFTDGLTEGCSPRQMPFGRDRLEAALRANAGESASQIRDVVLAEFNRFLEGERPEDDVTLLVLKRSA